MADWRTELDALRGGFEAEKTGNIERPFGADAPCALHDAWQEGVDLYRGAQTDEARGDVAIALACGLRA